jgi:hypothetical protein
MQVVRVPLRKLNGRLRIAVPDLLIESFGLTVYDSVDVIKDDNDVRLRIVKVAPPAASPTTLEPAE